MEPAERKQHFQTEAVMVPIETGRSDTQTANRGQALFWDFMPAYHPHVSRGPLIKRPLHEVLLRSYEMQKAASI